PGAMSGDWSDSSRRVTTDGDAVNANAPGTSHLTYDAVHDSGNHAAQKTRTVVVQDTLAPTITLSGSASMTLQCHVDSYSEPGASASDLCDSSVPVTIGGDTVNANAPGTYHLTYDAVDDSGNHAAQKTRTV